MKCLNINANNRVKREVLKKLSEYKTAILTFEKKKCLAGNEAFLGKLRRCDL